MNTKRFCMIILGLLCSLLTAPAVKADIVIGEEALFTTSTAPDALIVMDLSGSMAWNPPGDDRPYGSTMSCTADTTNCTGTGCSGGFCQNSKTGCSQNCSRLAIAKRSIFNILDDNNDNVINSKDETSLGVRLGYMRFYNCNDDDTGGSYTSGCITRVKAIGTKYSSIYCNSNSSCTSTSSSGSSVSGESALGGTPIASSLNEAMLYLNVHKAADNARDCRQKFVILITDGSDTFVCNGDGAECSQHRYKNRREVVAKAKALGDAGYKVFVIGFGSAMPLYLRNTLNWMAYYGGTDNPNSSNTGSTTAYSIVAGCSVTNSSACCSATNTAACYPAGVTNCATESTPVTATCYDADHPSGVSTTAFRASTNDPGYYDLSGYAFLATDADEMVAAVKAAINIIREATYSFSQSSIQSNRTIDENFIYEGSFQPVNGDPFWLGHLKKFSVNADGTVGAALWDAGTVLHDTAAASRVIKTYKAGALVDFTTGNLTAANLAVATDAARDAVVGYVRGEAAYNPDNWKLGDVFRSTPITVGTPSAYFDDTRDASIPSAFSQHRSNHVRSSSPYSGRVIVAGANDGQLHAFRTSDGSEAWSFIAPNLLSRLKLIAHATEPTSLSHQYFVDGPVTVADVWIPLSASDGRSKSAADWHTLMVFGEGRGAGNNLWSSSASCDSGFNPQYTTTFQYYCGYYGIDLTSSLNPVYKWRFNFAAAQSPYMGAPWSKVMTGRVLIGGNEKWVGFVGGGVYAPNATHSGKALFVVDLSNGNVLWSYTHADNTDLDNPMPAAPSIVDTDNDGFVDRVYIGDIGGSMWRFKLCTAADGDSCSTSNWTGGRLFGANASSGIRPIYTLASVVKDGTGTLWVYWGTGDKTDPTAANAQEKIYAIKDTDGTSMRDISSLQNITSTGSSYNDSSAYGYYINMTGQGEKVLADPTVFGGVLYVTTFTPSNSSNPCEQGGAATLYGVNATTGGGALPLTGTPRSMSIGTGIASAPVISLKPGSAGTPDLYVTTSGGGLIGAQTQRVDINPPGLGNRTNLLFWKDQRAD